MDGDEGRIEESGGESGRNILKIRRVHESSPSPLLSSPLSPSVQTYPLIISFDSYMDINPSYRFDRDYMPIQQFFKK
jgi:hypothetical protein